MHMYAEIYAKCTKCKMQDANCANITKPTKACVSKKVYERRSLFPIKLVVGELTSDDKGQRTWNLHVTKHAKLLNKI